MNILEELIERAKDQIGVNDFLFRTEFLACIDDLRKLVSKPAPGGSDGEGKVDETRSV